MRICTRLSYAHATLHAYHGRAVTDSAVRCAGAGMQRRKVLTEDGTDDRRGATVEKASMVSTDDPVIKGLDFDSSTGEEKPAGLPRAKPSIMQQARQRVDEAAEALKEAHEQTYTTAFKRAEEEEALYTSRKRQLPGSLRNGAYNDVWLPSEFKEMKAYYIAEHDHQESEVRWVRAVENYRDAEAAHAEAVHALKDAKIAMLLRRLRARRAVKQMRRNRKLGKLCII